MKTPKGAGEHPPVSGPSDVQPPPPATSPPRLRNGDEWCSEHQTWETPPVRKREHGGD
jgi:hypothetical protein